jgi:cytidylate kinase
MLRGGGVMAETKHTPAPWFVEDWGSDETREVISEPAEQTVAVFARGADNEISEAEMHANAVLTAAAPEIAEVLLAIWDDFQTRPGAYVHNRDMTYRIYSVLKSAGYEPKVVRS